MGLQYSITAIGSVILQVAVNSLGSLSVAAVTAASKVLNFLACPFDALGSTMATYGAQNVGASRYDRLNKGIYSASLMGFGYSLLALAIAWFFGRSLTGLFVSGDSSAQLVELAQTYMVTNVIAYPLLTLVNVVRFMIQGMGLFNVCDSRRRDGNDCAQPCRCVSCACAGLFRRGARQSAGVGSRRISSLFRRISGAAAC